MLSKSAHLGDYVFIMMINLDLHTVAASIGMWSILKERSRWPLREKVELEGGELLFSRCIDMYVVFVMEAMFVIVSKIGKTLSKAITMAWLNP